MASMEKYLAKHAFADCAANEFVYIKLAQAMGFKMPDAVLFSLGTTFLRLTIEAPSSNALSLRCKGEPPCS